MGCASQAILSSPLFASEPNLNWHNQEVVDAMFGEVRFWLDVGVDGLRLDAITTLTHDPELRNNPPMNANPKET